MPQVELPKAYDPKIADQKWYAFWEEQGFFKADPKTNKPAYSIVIPPPNVTGQLHVGHALVNVLQDILIRWKRMSGFETLWVPGTDHAGIATQTIVERDLLRRFNKRRGDFKRSEFIAICYEWKEKHEKQITSQLKQMGCSCDWSRLRFTMDEGCSKAVRLLFKKLYDDHFIYRGNYIVNWDPLTQTALADDEVEYEEKEGFLYYFNYPLADGSESITIATTRPETMLGDVAVAVSPKDQRYHYLIGKKIAHPLTGKNIPIIADPYVDPAFGTGMVKITPAHDPNDYKIGQNHHLPMINIFTPDAKLNENGGEFAGLDRFVAREKIYEKMKQLGLVAKVDPHTLRVGVSYRSKVILEPYLSKQWFVKVEKFIPILKEGVDSKKVLILPKTWEHTYFHWVNNLRDWCISRQLWWGHRIPVWYHKEDPSKIICFAGEGLPEEVIQEPENWRQDEDVLDTWFSSALWPLTTLGWPNKTAELDRFYPLSVLVTGHDILFFWVARMLFIDHYITNEFPFPETFLHGLIFGKSYWSEGPNQEIHYITGEERKRYDLGEKPPKGVLFKWEKLSKSKGNVIDPNELISDYGTDAMRMTLCATANQSPQIDLDYRLFEEYKNFANKVWNGARFIFLNIEDLDAHTLAKGLDLNLLTLEDQWILTRLDKTIHTVNQALEVYHFELSAKAAYDFFWKEFCAYYVEIAKPILFAKTGSEEQRRIKQKILVIVLCNALRLIHPMAPFITEELFQLFKKRFDGVLPIPSTDVLTRETLQALAQKACTVAPFPKSLPQFSASIEKEFALIDKIILAIRQVRGEMKIPPQMATELYIIGPKGSSCLAIAQNNVSILQALVKLENVTICDSPPSLMFSATSAVDELTILIPLPEELRQKEKERLSKEHERLLRLSQKLDTMLSNPHFVERANETLVTSKRQELKSNLEQLKMIEQKLKQL